MLYIKYLDYINGLRWV